MGVSRSKIEKRARNTIQEDEWDEVNPYTVGAVSDMD
jgi:hypothetical protein